jgi:hypothetical protein
MLSLLALLTLGASVAHAHDAPATNWVMLDCESALALESNSGLYGVAIHEALDGDKVVSAHAVVTSYIAAGNGSLVRASTLATYETLTATSMTEEDIDSDEPDHSVMYESSDKDFSLQKDDQPFTDGTFWAQFTIKSLKIYDQFVPCTAR